MVGTIFDIQRFSVHDGPGIRTTVFFKGCPLRCIWCHNPEGMDKAPVLSFDEQKCSLCGKCLSVCNARAIENSQLEISREKCIGCGKCQKVCLNKANEIIGKEVTAREVFDEVIKDRMFYDTSGGGITVTGGEPSYQPDFTLELLTLSREAGISLAVETCGAGKREFYEKAAALGTTFLYDIKCIDPVLHKKLTGADNSVILENLEFLMNYGADVIIRMPLVPGCNDSDEDILRLSEYLNKNMGRYRYAEIMPYHTLGISKSKKTGTKTFFSHDNADKADIDRWCALFDSCGTSVRVSE